RRCLYTTHCSGHLSHQQLTYRYGIPVIDSPQPTPEAHADNVTVAIDNLHSSQSPAPTSSRTDRKSFMMSSIAEVSRHNINLDDGEKEWLKWHQRLGHRSFAIVRFLMRTGTLAKSQRMRTLHTHISKQVEPPKCAACCYAKAKQHAVAKAKTHACVKDAPSSLCANTLYPGQEVSIDHLVSSVPGQTYTGYGKGHKSEMFRGSAIFVNNATGYIFVQHQKSLNTHKTLRAKEMYEANCGDLGVVPQKYCSDKAAVFHSHKYKQHLEAFSQTQKFAGVGQHHANGIVEKAIQDIQSTARICSLPPQPPPQRQHWSHTHGQILPPTLAPLQISRYPCVWRPHLRSRQENRGCPFHASTVPLVLNPRTGAITPQFNCIFDDWFATLSANVDDVPTFMEEQWQHLFGDSQFQFPTDDNDPSSLTPQSQVPLSYEPSALDSFEPSTSRYAGTQPSLSDPSVFREPSQPSFERESVSVEREQSPPANIPTSTNTGNPTPSHLQREQQTQSKSPHTTARKTPIDLPLSSIPPTSSSGPPLRRKSDDGGICGFYDLHFSYLGYTTTNTPKFVFLDSKAPPDSIEFLKTGTTDPDILSWDEAMAGPDRDKWREAALKEIRALEHKRTWLEAPESNATVRVIPGTWVFRVKRAPDGSIIKFKARWVLRGDLQDLDMDTTAEVVAWSSVRTFMVLSL
ncbi:unnamed protein product, partial [Cylindrotheca closterium]